MPVVAGTNIMILSGETLPIEVNVLNSEGEPALNIIAAKFALRNGETMSVRDCAITGSIVSVNFSQQETLLMSGDYEYEFRIRADDNDVDSLIMGRLRVDKGLIVDTI